MAVETTEPVEQIIALSEPQADPLQALRERESKRQKIASILKNASTSEPETDALFTLLFGVLFLKLERAQNHQQPQWWDAIAHLRTHDREWWGHVSQAIGFRLPPAAARGLADALITDIEGGVAADAAAVQLFAARPEVFATVLLHAGEKVFVLLGAARTWSLKLEGAALVRLVHWPSDSDDSIRVLRSIVDEWASMDARTEREQFTAVLTGLARRRAELSDEVRSAASRWVAEEVPAGRVVVNTPEARFAVDNLLRDDERARLVDVPYKALDELAISHGELLGVALSTHWRVAAAVVEREWSESRSKCPISFSALSRLLRCGPPELADRLRGCVAMAVAISESPHERADYVRDRVVRDEACRLLRMAELLCRAAAGYGAEAAGASAELERLAAASPQDWSALVLPALHTEERARVAIPLTVLLTDEDASMSGVIRASYEGATGAAKLRAAHLRALAEGAPGAGATVNAALASRIASELDRDRVFPSPLAAPGATWMCDEGLERELRDRADHAGRAFLQEYGDQFGSEEERLLEGFLRELKESLARRPAAWLGGAARKALRPEVSVQTRVHTKAEEAETNIDVAVIVSIDIAGSIDLQFAEAVQVKKALRKRGGGFKQSWQIDLEQLGGLLASFPTAVYLFVHPEGVPFVVPAKLIRGLANGRLRATGRRTQESVVVSYSELRAAAIPVGQFLVDLLVGTWLGRADSESLKVAAGDDPHLRPRVTVELSLRREPASREGRARE